MNFLGSIGSIFAKAFGVVKVAVGIGVKLLPFVKAAREMSPEVDAFLDNVEQRVQEGGEEADDFLDRNQPTLQAMQGFYAELAVVARTGEAWVAYALLVSQTETPDSVDPGEAKELALLINAHRVALQDLATKTEESDLEAKLLALK
jgi:cell division septum initiation protein DivIVA